LAEQKSRIAYLCKKTKNKMMKLKFVIALLAIAGCFGACESFEGNSNPKDLLNAAKTDDERMKVLNNLSSQLQGIWRSEDDPKSELWIQGDKFTSVYEGKEVEKKRLLWYTNCPGECGQGPETNEMLCFTLETDLGATCYNMVSLSNKKLAYTQLPGTGKTLSYTKTMDIPKQGTPQ